jgi:predicted RNase H-like nuclease (RuvC/YqgF family)
MFNKIWGLIFNTKEKNMPETNNKQLKVLQSKIEEQNQMLDACSTKVNNLTMRISQLVDENVLLGTQLNRLQETVAADIKHLYERLS